MPGDLHIIRHGEALHNICESNRSLLDPLLTMIGSDQARALKTTFPYRDRPIKIFSSPLRRALQTALIAFDGLLMPETGKVICLAEAQETGSDPCDTGLALADLSKYLTEQAVADHVDLTRVPMGWDSKTGQWSEDDDAVRVRARRLLDFLVEDVEKGVDVVLVTHGYFIHFLIEDWDDFAVRGHACGFRNCEFRSYNMVRGKNRVKLEETERSSALRNAPPTTGLGVLTGESACTLVGSDEGASM